MTPAHPPADPPLRPADIDRLQSLLDALPPPLEPLDVSAIDGFLCGVLVQPVALPASRWLQFVFDADGRPVPAGNDVTALRRLVERRHAELDRAIAQRQWFDPWVFELDGAALPSEAVAPWVAGFSLATEHFPDLTQGDARALTEPLVLLYRHLDPEDLEDADGLLAEIETLEPPADLTDAVEDLVSATLLLADIGRPLAPRPARPGPPRRAGPHRPGRPPRR